MKEKVSKTHSWSTGDYCIREAENPAKCAKAVRQLCGPMVSALAIRGGSRFWATGSDLWKGVGPVRPLRGYPNGDGEEDDVGFSGVS